jgi:hypothetical protein
MAHETGDDVYSEEEEEGEVKHMHALVGLLFSSNNNKQHDVPW